MSLPLPSLRTLLILAAVVSVGAVGAMHSRGRDARPAPADTSMNVVDFTGTPEVKFGATTAELARDQGLTRNAGDCHPVLPRQRLLSPVFVDDKLALLWVSAPMHTPEGVTVGTPVSQVRTLYPQASAMPAPNVQQYPGILATSGDRGYLFLYSGDRVSKLLVGYQQYLRQLYQSGGDTC